MRRRVFLTTTAIGALGPPLAAGLSTMMAPRPSRPRPPARRHVVLVDWDGVDPRYIDAHLDGGLLPNLRSLAKAGGRSVAACTYKAVSNPNRASLATGARPAVHGNVAYVLDPATGRAIGQTRILTAENIAQSLRRQGGTVVSAGWYIVQDEGAAYGDPEGLYTQGATWEENVDTAVRVLRGEPVDSGGVRVTVPRIPDLLAVYTADVDAIGHEEGPGSERIPRRLAELDAGLGRIIDAVGEAGIAARTTFVFVSDHGMTGYTESLEPQVLGAIGEAGHTVQRLYSGQAPDPGTEVVLTATPRAANVYLRGDAATGTGRGRIESLLRGLPELEGVHGRAELDAMGAAAAEGDFVIEARPPYAFLDPGAVDGEEHGGHASVREAAAPLILAGAGIRRGAAPERPETVDVIPTVSRLLGVDPPADAQGRVLHEVLSASL